eukprot:GAHX01003728.1.p1 GENE.GAHX01003728.1~~GAHX01003728.1.p1  ORF type:complete len:63 (-),score=11.56 GAHX01003728.1:240-428(-)
MTTTDLFTDQTQPKYTEKATSSGCNDLEEIEPPEQCDTKLEGVFKHFHKGQSFTTFSQFRIF